MAAAAASFLRRASKALACFSISSNNNSNRRTQVCLFSSFFDVLEREEPQQQLQEQEAHSKSQDSQKQHPGDSWHHRGIADSGHHQNIKSFQEELDTVECTKPHTQTLDHPGDLWHHQRIGGPGHHQNVASVQEESDTVECAQACSQTLQSPESAPPHRLAVIDCRGKLLNHMSLTGYLVNDVDVTYLDMGHAVGHASLQPASVSSGFRFVLEFRDELAEIASAHTKNGDLVHVSGVVHELPSWSTGRQSTHWTWHLRVHDLKLVQDLGLPWKQFFKDRSQWWDIRDKSRFSVSGDFMHKKNQVVLSINDACTPFWVKQRFNYHLQDKMRLWIDVFANPSDWWDNRHIKVTPTSPDFRHRESDIPLWVKGKSTPPWVLFQLSELDRERTDSSSP